MSKKAEQELVAFWLAKADALKRKAAVVYAAIDGRKVMLNGEEIAPGSLDELDADEAASMARILSTCAQQLMKAMKE